MDDNFEDSSDVESDFFAHSITNEMHDIAYGLHDKGRAYINHFSGIKLKYKKLAGTWLTAVFLGLAFLAAHQEEAISRH